jgi:ubiquitin-conjugating enzyme E2 variant
MPAPRIQQRDATQLAAGYARSHRYVELCGIVVFIGLSLWLGARIALNLGTHAWLIPVGLLLGFIGADFFSGFVHWACDSWGSPETPVIGKIFIRTFREHHVDQKSITRHDFVETNGDNCLVASPALGLALLLPLGSGAPIALLAGMFVLSLTFFVFMTSQIHKWAHMDTPPAAIGRLQRLGVILGPEHHSMHHAEPFDRNYCITAGWCNAPLQAIGFFPTLERLITRVTGALPRHDDIGRDAAATLAARGTSAGPSASARIREVRAATRP